jgi:hypothetical protein
MEIFKEIINALSPPWIALPILMVLFFFLFPPSDWFKKWNRKLGIRKLWTNTGGLVFLGIMLLVFAIGFTDENFKLIILKPDNVPIVALVFLFPFFIWFSMKQAIENDQRLEDGEKPLEYYDPADKVLVWPDLVLVEFIALIICMAILLIWSVGLDAPLEEPANPASTPNPSKAPWYFLGLQEMLVYFDPWLAGVVFPTIIIIGLMAIPYIDINKKGSGYYSFKDRNLAVFIWIFGFAILWILLIVTGTFLRGPGWNFFGPFEFWDPHKVEPLTNINLSEFIYIKLFDTGLPQNILLREIWGFLMVGAYFVILPPVLAKTVFKGLHQQLGNFRYSVFIILLLSMVSLPVKMYLRWLFNLKYIVAIPEFFFNI